MTPCHHGDRYPSSYSESEEVNRLHFFPLFLSQTAERSSVLAAPFEKGYRSELILLSSRKGAPSHLCLSSSPFFSPFPTSHTPWPLMSVYYPLCLALPSAFCHYTARPHLPARDLFKQLSHRKEKGKEDQGGQAMWDEEKVLAGNKGCSELFRHKQEVLKRGGEVCAGQPSALSPPIPGFCTSS